jgi:hypothetical protein
MTNSVEVEFTFEADGELCRLHVFEDDLPLDKATRRMLRITRKALKEIFAEAKELAKDIKPGQRIVADYLRRDRRRGRSKDDFLVALCRYSPATDSMLQEVKGVAK